MEFNERKPLNNDFLLPSSHTKKLQDISPARKPSSFQVILEFFVKTLKVTLSNN